MTSTDRCWTGRVAFAGRSDASAVAQLLREMDAHYRPSDILPEIAVYRAMVEKTLDEHEGTRFALAFAPDGEPMGVACVAILRPGRNLQGLIYLKDLFVSAAARSRGIGRALMQFLASHALADGIGRIDFTTDPANTGAQRLYDELGAARQEKVSYTLTMPDMQRLARQAPES